MKVRFYTTKEIEEARVSMLDEQFGRCAICDRKLDRGIPDHCHRHGLIRGILCAPCNSGLGMFGDSIDTLLAAITYLRRSETTISEIEAEPDSDDRQRLRAWRLHNQTRDQQKRAAEWAAERARSNRWKN